MTILSQQQTIEALQCVRRELHIDVDRARAQRDTARSELSRVAALADSRGMQVETYERMIADLLGACKAAHLRLTRLAAEESIVCGDEIAQLRAAVAKAKGKSA